MKTTTFLAALLLVQGPLLGGTAGYAQAPGQAGPLDFLVQSVCLDPAGKPTSTLPVDPACTTRRLQRSDDPAPYRKHDWPNVLGDPATPHGYQASDSVTMQRGGRTLVVQTFDFGTNGRTFGTFDGGRGDGGQVALTLGDWSSFVLTEDGGGGVQWFIGEGCRSARPSDRRFLSWLIFREPVAGTWQDGMARLNIAPNIESCPRRFNDAYTRYRRDAVEFPFRIVGPAGDPGRAPQARRRRLGALWRQRHPVGPSETTNQRLGIKCVPPRDRYNSGVPEGRVPPFRADEGTAIIG